MENDLFPSRAGDQPFADRAFRMEDPISHDRPHDGCGCGRDDRDDTVSMGKCACHEGCGDGSWGLTEYPLAMVYASCQSFRALYDPATALRRGTLFTELDLPLGSESCGFTAVGDSCRMERRRV